MAREFDDNADNGIIRPQTWMGIDDIELPDGKKRTPWDGAHGTADGLWQDKMQSYQNKFDPEGHFKFDQNARWNGALVSSRTVDAGVSGTTAHGGHDNAVNEISWSSDRDTRLGRRIDKA